MRTIKQMLKKLKRYGTKIDNEYCSIKIMEDFSGVISGTCEEVIFSFNNKSQLSNYLDEQLKEETKELESIESLKDEIKHLKDLQKNMDKQHLELQDKYLKLKNK